MNQFVNNILPFCSVTKKHCNLSNCAEFLRIQAAIQQSRRRLDWGRVCVCECVHACVCVYCGGVRVEEVNSAPRGSVRCTVLIGRAFFGSLMARPRTCLLFSTEERQNKYLLNSVCVCKRYCGAMSWLHWVLSRRKSHCTTGSPNFHSLSGLCFLTSDYLMPPPPLFVPLKSLRKNGLHFWGINLCNQRLYEVAGVNRCSQQAEWSRNRCSCGCLFECLRAAGVQELQEEIGSRKLTSPVFRLKVRPRVGGNQAGHQDKMTEGPVK